MELAIIALYLIAIFGIGIYCNKFNNSIDDYLLAGRRLVWVDHLHPGGHLLWRRLCHRRGRRGLPQRHERLLEPCGRRGGYPGRLSDFEENGGHEGLHRDRNHGEPL